MEGHAIIVYPTIDVPVRLVSQVAIVKSMWTIVHHKTFSAVLRALMVASVTIRWIISTVFVHLPILAVGVRLP